MNDAELYKTQPNPQDPEVLLRLDAIKRRMISDLAQHLPDDWLENANAKSRPEFMKHMVTSKTMAQIIDIVAWTMLCIEKEERAGARPEE